MLTRHFFVISHQSQTCLEVAWSRVAGRQLRDRHLAEIAVDAEKYRKKTEHCAFMLSKNVYICKLTKLYSVLKT